MLENIHANLRQQYSDSPEYLWMLMSPEDTPEHQPREVFITGAIERRPRAWLDAQVAVALERLTLDQIKIKPSTINGN